jgi:hypothetical protein
MIPYCLTVPRAVVTAASHPSADIAQALVENEDHIILRNIGIGEGWAYDLSVRVPPDDSSATKWGVTIKI